MHRQSIATTLLCWSAAVAAAQAPEVPPAERPTPRLALVLSGGGARGIAHIGALRALEQAGLPVDAIAATSMGAVIGALHAAGHDADQLEAVVRSLDWAQLFSGRSDRRTLPVARRDDRHGDWVGVSFDRIQPRLPAGLLAEHRINRFLIEHLSPAAYAVAGDFDRLSVPFRAVTMDLATGDRVVLARGDLARAARASMSMPVFFPPVTWDGRALVDGGLVDNVPTGVARAFGAAVTVAIDITSPPLAPGQYATSLGVAAQVSDLLGRHRNQDFRVAPDVLVRPDLAGHVASDYSDFDALIRAGYEATRAAVPQIREKLAAAGVADLGPRPRPAALRQLEGTTIAEVTTRGSVRVSQRLQRRIFDIPLGRGYVMQRGLKAFDKVAASGLLEHAWLEFEPLPEGVRLVLRGKDAAANRVGVGLGYSEWEKARGSVRLRNQNTLGFGEQLELLFATSEAEALAQASLRGDRLLVAGLGYRAAAWTFVDKPRFFDPDGHRLGRARFQRQGGSVELRTALERWGLAAAGARFGRVKTIVQAGVPLAAAVDTEAALFASVVVDNLDDLAWPATGARVAGLAEWNLERLGATHPHWRLRVEARLARSRGRATLQLDGLAGLAGTAPPVYDQFRLGGPALVPGYRFDELKGPQALAAAASVRCRVLGPLQLLARVGAGDVFADRRQMSFRDLRWGASAGLRYRTPVGPLALELGVREGGASLLTLAVGWN